MFSSKRFKDLRSDRYIILGLILLNLILVVIWFRERNLIATGEEGIAFYNPYNFLKHSLYIWQDTGLGFSVPSYLTRVPFALFSAILFSFGAPGWMIQATMFFLIGCVATIFTYLLVREFFREKVSRTVPLTAALFYLLNPYTMSQIWSRFIFQQMWAFSFLPLLLWVYLRWSRSYKIRYLFLLGVCSIFFSYAFLNPGNILILWLPVGIFSILDFWFEKSLKKFIFGVLPFFFVWFVSSLWWLYPSFVFSSDIQARTHGGWVEAYAVLKSVSQYFPPDLILRMQHSLYFGKEGPFGDIYARPVFQVISWGFPTIILFSLTQIKKLRSLLYFMILWVLAFFIVKGANPPWGEQFFNFVFQKFAPATALRNSYEKAGILFALSYAVLFSFGVQTLIENFRRLITRRYSKTLIAVVWLIFFGIFAWPMWTGKVFGGVKSNVVVRVPNEYMGVNEFIVKNTKMGERVIRMPLLPGDGMTYDWGYSGIDTLHYLLDVPTISRISRSGSFDEDFYWHLFEHLEDQNFPNLLGLMNVKFILLEYGISQDRLGDKITYRDTEEFIHQWKGISEVEDFGRFRIFQLEERLIPARVFVASSIMKKEDLTGVFGEVAKENFLYTTVLVANSQNLFLGPEAAELDYPTAKELPEIKMEQLTPQKYKVHVKDAKGTYVLVLSVTFYKNWQAKIDNKPVSFHFVANGYANGWLVEKRGDYTIDIVFKVWPWD